MAGAWEYQLSLQSKALYGWLDIFSPFYVALEVALKEGGNN